LLEFTGFRIKACPGLDPGSGTTKEGKDDFLEFINIPPFHYSISSTVMMCN
jgi:hypothetical protein